MSRLNRVFCYEQEEPDQSQLEQIIMNLAVNARDAMPDSQPVQAGERLIRNYTGAWLVGEGSLGL